jgi:hypothetical protein
VGGKQTSENAENAICLIEIKNKRNNRTMNNVYFLVCSVTALKLVAVPDIQHKIYNENQL